jgi:hypothetical protein
MTPRRSAPTSLARNGKSTGASLIPASSRALRKSGLPPSVRCAMPLLHASRPSCASHLRTAGGRKREVMLAYSWFFVLFRSIALLLLMLPLLPLCRGQLCGQVRQTELVYYLRICQSELLGLSGSESRMCSRGRPSQSDSLVIVAGCAGSTASADVPSTSPKSTLLSA